MKKSRLVLACALVCAVLMASGPVQAKTVLNFIGHWAAARAGLFMEIANEYMEENPDIEIRFIHVKTNSYQGIPKLLLMTGNEETNPDIISAYSHVIPEMIAGGMLAPVPPPLAEKARHFFVPQLLHGLTKSGQLYGMPTENQTYVLGYSGRVFAESGMVDPPSTWDELQTYAQKLARINADGTVERYGLTFGGTVGEFAHETINLIWTNGGEYVTEEGEVKLNTPPVIETVRFMAGLVQNNVAAIKAPAGLGTGENAMSLMPNFRRNVVIGGADYPQIRTVPMPTNKGPQVAYHYEWGLHVSQKSLHPEEAWKFIEWLTMKQNEFGRTPMGEFMGSLGSLPTNLMDMQYVPEYQDKFFTGFLTSLSISRSEPLLPEITKRQQAFRDQVIQVLNGKMAPAGAVEQLQEQIEMIFEESK